MNFFFLHWYLKHFFSSSVLSFLIIFSDARFFLNLDQVLVLKWINFRFGDFKWICISFIFSILSLKAFVFANIDLSDQIFPIHIIIFRYLLNHTQLGFLLLFLNFRRLLFLWY